MLPLSSVQALNLDLGADTSICSGQSIILNPGSGFDSYLWSDSSNAQALLVNQTGLYWIRVDSAGIVDRDSIYVTVNSSPVSSFEVDTACQNSEITIRNFSFGSPDTITNYYWSFGNGDTSIVELPEYFYPNSGSYVIGLKVENQFGCSDSSSNSIFINPTPVVNIGYSVDTLNIGDTLTVNPIQVEGTVSWSPSSFISNPLNDSTLLFPNSSTVYTLTAVDSNTCSTSADLSILVNLYPNANDDLVNVDPEINASIDVLANDNDPENGITSITIEEGPSHGAATVIGDSIINYISDPAYAGYDTILYKICDFGTPPLCDFATLIILVRNSKPQAVDDIVNSENGLPVEVNVMSNDTDPNTAQTIEISYISTPENGSAENLGGGILSYTSDLEFSGVDEFFYVICDNGIPVLCDTAYVSVEVELSSINVVNSFSPNNDGVYDVFTIEGIRNFPENKLIIFSRWGDIIYEKSGYANDWDGSRGFSEEVPEGVYFYQLELNDGSDPVKGYLYLKR